MNFPPWVAAWVLLDGAGDTRRTAVKLVDNVVSGFDGGDRYGLGLDGRQNARGGRVQSGAGACRPGGGSPADHGHFAQFSEQRQRCCLDRVVAQ